MGEVTIKEVARRAGVSVGTVSRVINGAQNIKLSNLRKVEQAITELNFRPNQYAQGLKSNKSNIIGIIVPNLINEFFLNISKGIEQLAISQGYLAVVLDSEGNPELERKYIEFLWEKRVDGIVITTEGGNEDLLVKIRDSGTPVIFVDRKPQAHLFDTVYMDKYGATKLAMNYLIERGHNRIAFVTGRRDLSTNTDRFNGYIEALYSHDIPIRNEYIHFGTFSKECGLVFMDWYASLSPETRPTAVMSGSAIITYGILCGAKRQGVGIPDDLSLISFGSLSMEELLPNRITYIEEMKAEVSEITAELIMERIHNPFEHVKQMVLTSKIVPHDTVKDLSGG